MTTLMWVTDVRGHIRWHFPQLSRLVYSVDGEGWVSKGDDRAYGQNETVVEVLVRVHVPATRREHHAAL